MKKFLIIVFLVVVFSFNFNWVYGQNCQNDISVSSTKACVIDKIKEIIIKIDTAKYNLEKFEYGARYGNMGESFNEAYLNDIISVFRKNKDKIQIIKNKVSDDIIKNKDYKEACRMERDTKVLVGVPCRKAIDSLLSPDFYTKSPSSIIRSPPFSNLYYAYYGVSIILEDTNSYIFLSITNEGRERFSTEGVGDRVLQFLDKLPSFLTYLESFRDIGSTTKSFKKESKCTTTLEQIITRINNTTSLDYIRKVDININAFDQAISKKHFLDTFKLISQGGIVIAFFGNDPLSGVWQEGKYYQLGVYLKNIDNAAKTIRTKANDFINAYNLYLNEACTINFFETGKTPSGIKAEELVDKMASLIIKGYIEVQNIDVPIAVIPPVVWSDEHLGTKTLAAITPERVFNEVRNFVFSLAPFVFTILLLTGALFYLLSPFDVEKIKTGSEYIKWAVFGYFLLLIITSILLALRFIFGGP
jgi:hypothetical protein